MARIANEISGMRRVHHRHGVYSLFSANDVNTFLNAPHSAHCFAIRREGLAFRDADFSVSVFETVLGYYRVLSFVQSYPGE